MNCVGVAVNCNYVQMKGRGLYVVGKGAGQRAYHYQSSVYVCLWLIPVCHVMDMVGGRVYVLRLCVEEAQGEGRGCKRG